MAVDPSDFARIGALSQLLYARMSAAERWRSVVVPGGGTGFSGAPLAVAALLWCAVFRIALSGDSSEGGRGGR